MVCRRGALRGSPPRQGHGHREGHAQLHRQPHRALRRHPHARGAAVGAIHDRGDRHDHGARRSAGRRARRSARATSPASTSWRTWRAPCTTGSPKASARRSGRRRCWTTCSRADGSERRREGASTGARRTRAANPTSSRWIPATMTYRAEAVRTARLDRGRQGHRGRARARTHAVHGRRHGRRVPARDAGADARLHRPGRAADRQQHRRRGSRDAVGLRLGARAVRAVRRDWRPRGRGRLARAGAGRRRRAAAGSGGARQRAQPVPGRRRFHRPRRASQILRTAKERSAGHPQERRRQPRGSRRRRRSASSSTRR